MVHLAPSQVWHRMRLAARRRACEWRAEACAARFAARAARLPPARLDHPGLARVARLRCERRTAQEARAAARDALAGRFRFLDVTRDFGSEIDWHRADLDTGTRLWKTLLHEFPYALDLARAGREEGDPAYAARLFELIRSWQAASPIGRPGFALDAWNARAVATRAIHWSVAASLLELRPDSREAELLGRQLALHAVFLRDNLELDLRGNHLLRDAVGLVFACELTGHPADALELLRAQVGEQLLDDGCHVERVPLYHAIALQDLVECRALLGETAPDWLEQAVTRMARFLAHLLPADGSLPLLGDSWHGEVEPRRLLAEAGRESAPLTDPVVDRASGLSVLRRGDAHVVVRAGAHGPDYLLGHAHADGLSFEASIGEIRVVTDTGTPTYDDGPPRRHARSTAAHNTVQLDGAEQIECWGSFRVGRRGRGRVVARGDDERFAWLWAAHDGYRFLPGRPEHQRLLALSSGALLVLDAVRGRGRHRVASALHLHPDGVARVGVGAFAAALQEEAAPLHERFNATREMTRLCVRTEETALPWYGGWVVVFARAHAPIEAKLHPRDGGLHASCRLPEGRLGVDWNLASRGGEGVSIVLDTPDGESAK